MQIFRALAGYSCGRADIVRRAMAKKKHREMEKERVTFIEGCKKNNQNIEISNLQLLVDEKDAHKEVALKEFLEHSEDKKNPPRLYGSGMLVINSPWMLKDSTEAFINNIEKIIRR